MDCFRDTSVFEATLCFLASLFGFLPQVGAPTAMKYGRHELKNGTDGLIYGADTLATIADNVAILAVWSLASTAGRGMEATIEAHKLKQMNQQLLAADIREKIAEK